MKHETSTTGGKKGGVNTEIALNIYDFITQQKSAYLKPISLEDGWHWSMKDHLRRSFLYKHSQFEEHNDDRDLRPFKNIVRPILNIQYRTEGFDVKDIEIYVNDPDSYHMSFLVKKFHEDWALENSVDTFIDNLVESHVDYGGTLVKKADKPEVVDLRSIAFCDQSDLLSAPFAILHFMGPSELREMEEWGKESNGANIEVEQLITLSGGEEVEVYEVHGMLPNEWFDGNEGHDTQIQIIAFYKDDNDDDIGITLFKKKQPKLPFKFLKRDPVFGRALGFGGVEELFDAQTWTNYSEIQIAELLEHASKVFYKSTDPAFKTRNNLLDAEQGEVFTIQEGRDIGQLDNSPRNLAVFNDSMDRWEATGQQIGAASEGLLGESPSSGTPFKLFEAQNIEARGLHKYRQGKIAVFVDEIYRDWIIPDISRAVTSGQKFLAELSFDELLEVSEKIVAKAANEFAKEKILSGQVIFPGEVDQEKERAKEQFAKGGNKRFLEILKDDLKGKPLKVKTNIAGKQKNLALLTDKIVNVLRQFISTPQIRQDPEMVKLLNVILESSGMSPIMFGGFAPQLQAPQQGGGTEALKDLGQTAQQAQQQV